MIPDLCHDMHDCPISTGDAWLKAQVVPLLRSPELRGGVVFVVFDEGAGSDDRGGGGRVDALALGPTVRHGATFRKPTNHYGLLRTSRMRGVCRVSGSRGERRRSAASGSTNASGIARTREETGPRTLPL